MVLIFITQAQLLPSVYRLPINECSHSENQFDQNERRLDAFRHSLLLSSALNKAAFTLGARARRPSTVLVGH